jgi:hypothetical protein
MCRLRSVRHATTAQHAVQELISHQRLHTRESGSSNRHDALAEEMVPCP